MAAFKKFSVITLGSTYELRIESESIADIIEQTAAEFNKRERVVFSMFVYL
jgi:hypothetical protein